MKVAIFHDYFGTIGGGEKVVLHMARILDADIITTDTDALGKMNPDARVISLGSTPKIPGLKQVVALLKFRFCDFSSDYDFFIFSGNWAHYAAHRHHPNLWYCHAPVRAFYDLFETFCARMPFVQRQLFRCWVTIHRFFDKRSVGNIGTIVTNSRNTRARIRDVYSRDADVLYPPVDALSCTSAKYGDFWLSVNRIYPEKRIGLQIDAFRLLPDERLVIVGGYAGGDHAAEFVPDLMDHLPENVLWKGEISGEELDELYRQCRGLVCTALDEDFGMTPLEAMACGKPVVAVNEGGFRETVTPATGVLVTASAAGVAEGILTVSRAPAAYRDACRARAREFDCAVFRSKLVAAVQDAIRVRGG